MNQLVSLELPQHIDSTMLSCFRSCPRRFYNEFVLGLRPAALSKDLHAGACFASALEDVYQGIFAHKEPFDDALKRAFANFVKNWGDFVPPKESPKTQENVWHAVEEYFRNWSPLTDPVQPYDENSFEFTFGIPLLPALPVLARDGIGQGLTISTVNTDCFPLHPSGQPFIYSGRFDLLGKYFDKPVVRDEKTTTSIASRWSDQWNLRSQFLGYCWACQQSGLPIDTVVVRGVGILKTKITLVEAIKTYSDHMIAKWLEQTRRDLWRLRRCWDEGYFDYNLADACTSYGGCSFTDLCTSPEPERWYGNFVTKRWNPLRKDPTSEAA